MPYVKASDGVDIYYEATGSGTPFLFLSETACDGAVWNLYQTPEFSRDHCVVTLDYRGTGLSGKPSNKYSTAQFAADAVAVLDHLGLEGAIVCGHSMGGRVAQLIAHGIPGILEKLIDDERFGLLSNERSESVTIDFEPPVGHGFSRSSVCSSHSVLTHPPERGLPGLPQRSHTSKERFSASRIRSQTGFSAQPM